MFVGDTILHLAASLGQLELCEYLLENGAQIDVPNQRGRTPLHRAIENSQMLTARVRSMLYSTLYCTLLCVKQYVPNFISY